MTSSIRGRCGQLREKRSKNCSRQEESDDEQFCDVNILLGQKNVDHGSLKLKAHFSDNEAGFIRTPPRPKPRQRTSIDYNVDSDDFFDPGNLHLADGSKEKRLIRFGQKDQLKLKAHFLIMTVTSLTQHLAVAPITTITNRE